MFGKSFRSQGAPLLILLIVLCLVLCFLSPLSGAFSESVEPSTITDLAATTTDLRPSFVVNRIDDPSLPWPFTDKDELCEVWFPRIRDCDAALVLCGGEAVLIDCADYGQSARLVELMQRVGVSSVNAIYNSHPHHDHTDGLELVSDWYRINAFYICFHEYYTETMRRAMSLCSRREIPVVHYEDGDVFEIGGATLTAWLKGDPWWDLNNQSAVMRLCFGDRAILFTSDIGHRAEERLASALPAEELRADILKSPHHGLKQLQDDFYEAVLPELCVITNIQRMVKPIHYLNMRNVAHVFTSVGIVHLATDGRVWAAELLQEDDLPFSSTTPAPTVAPTPVPTIPPDLVRSDMPFESAPAEEQEIGD